MPASKVTHRMATLRRMKDGHTTSDTWSVADLFSGGGGISCGFHMHPQFRIVGAADAQMGKPSSGPGALGCNSTYELNIGIRPAEVDLGSVSPTDLRTALGLDGKTLDVLLACPPCTGFSRTNAANHVKDDPRNSLVSRVGDFVGELQPKVLWMENARELVTGRFGHHLQALKEKLDTAGYDVHEAVHMLNRFGLPQIRERAVVVAVRRGVRLHTIEEAWGEFRVDPRAVTVRRAIGHLPRLAAGETSPLDAMHASPSMTQASLERLVATPADGGSWSDLARNDALRHHLTPAQVRSAENGDWGSHPDVYGRLWWDKPAVTIKRECAHIGNGRYAHPEQHRLCSVREMAILNGFPPDYQFGGSSLSNKYRHIGDAVPPLISYQMACVTSWMLGGSRPGVVDLLMPGCSLRPDDVIHDDVSANRLPLFASSISGADRSTS